jgi:integrase
MPIQQVRGGDLNRAYREAAARGLADSTVKLLHKLARRVFGHALKQGDIKRDPSTEIDAPRVAATEAAVLRSEEIPVMLKGLQGPMLTIAIVALGTGMRRGELCALRWQDVDLDKAKLEVRQSLEQTRRGLRFKEPKTKRGLRSISLSPSVIACLQEHRVRQLEQRMRLGQGRPGPDALVFATFGGTRTPDGLTRQFGEAMKKIGLGHVGLHSLRHTHASLLIKAGEDILTVSRRLGHSSAAITLGVYGHLISSKDGAANAVEAILGSIR